MPSRKSPRKGSLQFWPRKRAARILPSVNWKLISGNKGVLKGFIAYKVGMASAYITDNTADSLTKSKKITIPATILECPPIKIFSIRFYKNSKVAKDVLSTVLEKELKKKIKLPKKQHKLEDVNTSDYDDVSIIAYSNVKKTGLKKKPDMIEIRLNGSGVDEKLNFIKENLNKDISVLDVFEAGALIDIRGVTTGKGFQGPVKRFGINLKSHKSEKGVRRPGNVGPWHPARVIFRVPMAGQTGFQTRVIYNNKILTTGTGLKLDKKRYGNVKTDYLIVNGSVMGSAKRQVVITAPLRKSKRQDKRELEFIELR